MANTYTWTDFSGGTAENGTLFTVFLTTLNNTCRDDETVDCTTIGDADCAGYPGGPCGFAGYRDWQIPKVGKDTGSFELEAIVSFTQGLCGGGSGACISPVFGPTAASLYWSATTDAMFPFLAWLVGFSTGGFVFNDSKHINHRVRAVRPSP